MSLNKEEIIHLYNQAQMIDRHYNKTRKEYMLWFNTDNFLAACTVTELGYIKEDIGDRLAKARINQRQMV